jgi:tetratricopeptide (TPR) repeat protein
MQTLKEIEKKLEFLLGKENFSEIINLIDELDLSLKKLPNILCYKGISFLRTSRFLEAKNILETALQENYSDYKIVFNTGLAHFFLKNYERSNVLFEDALKIKRNDILTIIYLARSLFESKKIKNSFKLLENALNVYPSNPNLYFELSSLFFKIKNYSLAIKFYLKVNDYELAIKNLEIQKTKTPDNYLVYYNLGNVLREIGNISESEKYYYKAIEMNPNHSQSYRMLTGIKKFRLEDEFVSKLKLIIEFHKNNHNSLLEAYYALSKIYEDNKDYRNSFDYFTQANKLRRDEVQYSGSFIKQQFLMLRNLFNENFVKKLKSSASFLSKKPIFIVGMPRSGTTLAEQIISSHKDVVSGGELTIMQSIIKKNFPKNDYDLFAKDVADNLNLKLESIGREYCNELNKINGSKRVTDKLPFNFIFIGFIKCCLPEAKIIHCVRNAKDTCISILKNYFPLDDVGFAHNESEIVEYYKEYTALMNYWKSIFKNEIFDFSYEQNILNPKKTLENLLEYLELDWDDNCLNHHKSKNIIKTISTFQARQPIYNSSINAWAKYEDFLSSDFKSLN